MLEAPMTEHVEKPLPDPASAELARLFPLETVRKLYGFLYSRRDSPPSTNEIEGFVTAECGEPQSEAMRRLRSLRDCFIVQHTQKGKTHRYRLVGWKPTHPSSMRGNISNRVRAQVLAPQRCAQCGKTPLEDRIKLVIDHKMPISWGGNDAIENLQPLCEGCNSGKRDFYATFDQYADEIRLAIQHDEPHGRIGELLKALEGQWVPSEVLSVAASMKQYQDDWQRRLRELRDLDWEYKNSVTRPPGSIHAVSRYQLIRWRPWPSGTIRAELDRINKLKKKGK